MFKDNHDIGGVKLGVIGTQESYIANNGVEGLSRYILQQKKDVMFHLEGLIKLNNKGKIENG